MATSRSSRGWYIAAALLLISITIASPLFAHWLATYDVDWTTLSDVGQSYGAVAALLSGAALLGVVVTVSQQSRHNRASAEQAVRQMHFELMREAWEDAELLEAMEIVPAGEQLLAKRFAYINANFMYLRTGYLSGQVTLAEVEDIAAHSFSTTAGNYFWRRIENHFRRHLEWEFTEAMHRGFLRSQNSPEGFFLHIHPQTGATPPAESEESD